MNSQIAKTVYIPELCKFCKYFFANLERGSYCSRCYDELCYEKIQPIENYEEYWGYDPYHSHELCVDKAHQQNLSVCFECNKKAGHLPYECKCGHVFCKKHRLPEQHACQYDFLGEGRERLAEENPLLKKDKLERI